MTNNENRYLNTPTKHPLKKIWQKYVVNGVIYLFFIQDKIFTLT